MSHNLHVQSLLKFEGILQTFILIDAVMLRLLGATNTFVYKTIIIMNGYDFIQLVVFKMQYAYRFTMHIQVAMTTQGGSHDSAEFRYSTALMLYHKRQLLQLMAKGDLANQLRELSGQYIAIQLHNCLSSLQLAIVAI